MAGEVTAAQIDAGIRGLADQSVDAVRKERRRWSALLKNAPPEQVFQVAIELLERFDRRWVAYELMLKHPSALGLVTDDNVVRLAGEFRGWGDVDQFGVLLAGPAWRARYLEDATIHAWAKSVDRWWRRSALVATVPLNVRSQGGSGDAPRTLAVCELLVADRDDLVTKALSWALRELIVHDRQAVEAVVVAHEAVLAPRVKREVNNKLRTGLKTAPSNAA